MKYIQSFYQYPVTFSSLGKTVPARSAQGELRNIAEVTDRELVVLQNREPFFRELVNQKKYRVLNHLPESYVPPAKRINEANDEIARLKAENERLRNEKPAAQEKAPDAEPDAEQTAELDVDKMSYKELQELAAKLGIEYKNVKKTDLVAAIKAAQE